MTGKKDITIISREKFIKVFQAEVSTCVFQAHFEADTYKGILGRTVNYIDSHLYAPTRLSRSIIELDENTKTKKRNLSSVLKRAEERYQSADNIDIAIAENFDDFKSGKFAYAKLVSLFTGRKIQNENISIGNIETITDLGEVNQQDITKITLKSGAVYHAIGTADEVVEKINAFSCDDTVLECDLSDGYQSLIDRKSDIIASIKADIAAYASANPPPQISRTVAKINAARAALKMKAYKDPKTKVKKTIKQRTDDLKNIFAKFKDKRKEKGKLKNPRIKQSQKQL